MFIVKNLLFAIALGFIGYEAVKVFLMEGFTVPATTPELSLLFIFILTSFASTFAGRRRAAGAGQRASTSSDSREEGTVKWFNVRKGYGFITRDHGDDIFVHFRSIEDQNRRGIDEGERVSFIVTNSDKGLQAEQVKSA